MDSLKAICDCKNKSEDYLVVGIRKKPLDGWGFWHYTINIILLIITAGGWFPFLIGWLLGKYFFHPKYACQHCGEELPKENYR